MTYFEKWQQQLPGYTNGGGFETKLMELYQHADGTNKRILQTSYPGYFTETGDQGSQEVTRFEFKLRGVNTNSPWEEIEIFSASFVTWSAAETFAKMLADKFCCDVRMNEAGSYNGHYY